MCFAFIYQISELTQEGKIDNKWIEVHNVADLKKIISLICKDDTQRENLLLLLKDDNDEDCLCCVSDETLIAILGKLTFDTLRGYKSISFDYL